MILEIILNIAIVAAAFVFMEFVAWFTHKYVMHGFLWVLHRDHHVPHKGAFEWNDLFVVWFAAPAVIALVFGIRSANWPLISAGIGITIYGIGYSLFHDVMFHKRLKWLKIPARSRYFKRIVNAHRAHHRTTGRADSRAFGFLWASRKYNTPLRS